MSRKYNNGQGAGICDECGLMLWTGFIPDHTPIAPYNRYGDGKEWCKDCDLYQLEGYDVVPVESHE